MGGGVCGSGTSRRRTTGHPTADLNAVDRFHPWLSVGADGTVYVAYYDTRHSVNRIGVDFYFSQSTDGGNSWSAPARLTGVTSPNLTSDFEWGDYNGLDVVASQFLLVFTDNRNEGGGAGNSPDVYAAAANISAPSCTPVTASHISHFTGANCQGEEHYYTPLLQRRRRAPHVERHRLRVPHPPHRHQPLPAERRRRLP